MKSLPLAVLLAMLVAAPADAQTTTRLRGTITAIDGNTMSVKSRDGADVKVQLPDNVAVSVAKAIKFEDIKQGDLLGVTTMPGPDGTMNAIEVHYLPPTVREGQGPWDLRPGEYIFAGVQTAPDGTMTAPRIQVSKDGVKPPL